MADPSTAPPTSVRPAPPAGMARIVAELALIAVHVTVALSFARVYGGWSFAGPLLAFTLGGHLLAVATRWARVPAPAAALIAVGGAVLVSTWILFGETTRYWLPTAATWDAARQAGDVARDQFSKVVAPTAPLDGFQLGAGLMLWASIWFADWAAFRLRATIEAVAPAAAIFVFVALFGSGRDQLGSAVAFTAAVLIYVAAHRAMRAVRDQAWLASSPAAGGRAMVRAAGAVALVAILAGAIVGPRLPGAGDDALVSWRHHAASTSSRVTISPLVDIRKRLVQQSATEVFTVRANRPAYWRLTSLDRFDGQIWSSSGRFSPAGTKPLPTERPDIGPAASITQRVEIEGLSAIWAPAAFEARSVPRSSDQLRWDENSSTLIVDAAVDTSDGLTYTVVSSVPRISAATLSRASDVVPADMASHYEALPADFPDSAIATARGVTAGAGNHYEVARTLQDWFRENFTYDTTVSAGHSDSALVNFLDTRRGYCEQFAGTYAAMARSLGLPARVAVGFTPGSVDPNDPSTYHVRGQHAHAWPEVWFAGVGWVAFEPTPGRGNPDGEAHTGVAPQQDDSIPQNEGDGATTTVPAPTTTTAATPSTTVHSATTIAPQVAVNPPGEPPTNGGVSGWVIGFVVVVLAGLAWLLMLLAAPYVRRRLRQRDRFAQPVLYAWTDSLVPVRWATGLAPFPAETHREFARRAADPLGNAGERFRELAEVVTATAWAPSSAPTMESSAAQRAAELRDSIGTEVDERSSWSERLRHRLSWREAFGRPLKPQ